MLKKALQDKNEQLKKEYDEKQKDIDRQNQIIRDSKFECVSEENIFSIPRSKRFLYLNDEAKVFNCELQGYSARDKALYNIPQNIKKMNLDFVKNLTQSCKTGVGFDQQCKTEEDCRYWGFGKDGKGNTCNLYTKKCIKLAKGGNKQNGIYDCNNDGWFSKLSYGKYVDAEKVCRLNGFVAGISSNYYGKFDKYEEMCKPQNNQKGITETNKIKTVDKDMLVSWKCVGERQKPAVFLYDSPKVPTTNKTTAKQWSLYQGTYDLEGSKLLGINFNTIKSLKINQNFKAIVFSATDSSKKFHNFIRRNIQQK